MTHNIHDLIRATYQVLLESGDDYTYQPPTRRHRLAPCVYSADGGKTGSCLLGRALIDHLGVEYTYWDNSDDTSIVAVVDDVLVPDGTFEYDQYSQTQRAALGVLEDVQYMQDNGAEYGKIRAYMEDNFTPEELGVN